jgi:hypothetical protein
MIKTDWLCWHATYVRPGESGWEHPNSQTQCDDQLPLMLKADGAAVRGTGRDDDKPAPPIVACCGGKMLNDGTEALCGRVVAHPPHALDRAPRAIS